MRHTDPLWELATAGAGDLRTGPVSSPAASAAAFDRGTWYQGGETHPGAAPQAATGVWPGHLQARDSADGAAQERHPGLIFPQVRDWDQVEILVLE